VSSTHPHDLHDRLSDVLHGHGLHERVPVVYQGIELKVSCRHAKPVQEAVLMTEYISGFDDDLGHNR
jgi:hypothetical protein